MKFVITLGAFSVVALAIWLCVDAFAQSRDISLPATFTAVRDLTDH
ncbi:hypothetical protein SAMN05444172_9135 [Burkholderia sp. GAS332]|jgi:hypothetical protein|nr:hypothetical protein SAMN05444172_9135 [Burkholderia sp. GAS332]